VTLRIPKGALVAVLTFLMVGASAAAAYFVGFAVADRDGAFDRGRSAGRTAGFEAGRVEGREAGHSVGYRKGRDETLADYRPGAPAYKRIFAKGRRSGIAAGRVAGYAAGSSDAFAGFDGGWEIGGWYIVHFGQPVAGESYRIESRVPMDTGESYNICPDDADEVCGGPLF
jgi:hypothetical protein